MGGVVATLSTKMAPAELARYAELIGGQQGQWLGDLPPCLALWGYSVLCVLWLKEAGVPTVEPSADSLEGSKYSTPSLEHGFCFTWLLKVFVLSLSLPHHQAVANLSLVT